MLSAVGRGRQRTKPGREGGRERERLKTLRFDFNHNPDSVQRLSLPCARSPAAAVFLLLSCLPLINPDRLFPVTQAADPPGFTALFLLGPTPWEPLPTSATTGLQINPSLAANVSDRRPGSLGRAAFSRKPSVTSVTSVTCNFCF